MQATPYVPVTNFAADERANAGGRSTVRTDRVDAEFDAIATTTDELIGNLEKIQRDDGRLRDGVVEPYNFSSTTKAYVLATKWNARGLWQTGVVYAVNDLVDVNGVGYVCPIAHASTVFSTDYAAGKWQVLSADGAVNLPFAPTANIAASNVQAAVVEIDADARLRDNVLLAAFYGAI